MPNIPPSLRQLKRAIALSEKIQTLETELAGILGLSPESVAKKRVIPGLGAASFLKNSAVEEESEAPAPRRRGRPPGKKSAKSGKAAKAAKSQAKSKNGRHFSPEAREKIAAAQRKRWAKFAKGKKRK